VVELSRAVLLWREEIPVRDEKWLEGVNDALPAGDLRWLRVALERGWRCGGGSWTKVTV
jgi:hypothetical protein